MATPEAVASLLSSAQQSVSTAGRSLIIQLKNNTSEILRNPQVYTSSGYCFCAPEPTVGKGVTAVITFVKTSGTACGAVGVLTYDIAEDQKKRASKRLAIMFSVPYDYTYYENWIALGVFETSQACDHSLYELMYYYSGSFRREKASGGAIRHEHQKYSMRGTMSPAANSEMKVELDSD